MEKLETAFSNSTYNLGALEYEMLLLALCSVQYPFTSSNGCYILMYNNTKKSYIFRLVQKVQALLRLGPDGVC